MPNNSDDKFLQQKDSLVKDLQDIAEFLGDEDAKNVRLQHTVLRRQLDAESANSADQRKAFELEAEA